MRLRPEDELTADIVYKFSDNETHEPASAFKDANTSDREFETDDLDNYEATEETLKFSNVHPRISRNHHHYLFQISDIKEEEVYCDNCIKMVPEGGRSWTCLAPHCHYDECEQCSSGAEHATTNDIVRIHNSNIIRCHPM